MTISLLEIQIRTALQHAWAEMPEKFSDVIDPSIKYGGNATIQGLLQDASRIIAGEETVEKELDAASLLSSDEISDDLKRQLDAAQEVKSRLKPALFELFRALIAIAPRFKGREQ
jgi:ppGpp synthetase/RelA/SpoT-type nucleotidyltranferase